MTTPSDAGPASLELAPVLDLKAATPLAQALLALRGRDVTVNAAAVERLGAQCLQVLLSARNTWTEDGAQFAVTEPSETFVETLALLGAPYPTYFQPSELAA
ncbi:STAS domain-containing protein [Phenylobacterium sp. J367]|uniref:STAS domain-containing protein n=1 Tax=Phenylobacterium sp. J367 TaxID=2898435 RepID=UPI002151764E|nr:STAS domain-containing protein [Phenylobacterium sp. J367]MCR5877629.1 STAS domain-containing protein [Phenylobacterium sp. J367]